MPKPHPMPCSLQAQQKAVWCVSTPAGKAVVVQVLKSFPHHGNPCIAPFLGHVSVMQNLYFGTGREARWLEGGSRFPADLVPRTLAHQQQAPKTELALAVCFGSGRRREGPSPSAQTEEQHHHGGDWLTASIKGVGHA